MCMPHNPHSPPWLSLWIRTNWGKWLMFNEQVASLEGHIWSQGQAAESFSLGLVLLWRSCVSMRPCKDRLLALLCQVSLRIPPATWMVRREVWWRVLLCYDGAVMTLVKSQTLFSRTLGLALKAIQSAAWYHEAPSMLQTEADWEITLGITHLQVFYRFLPLCPLYTQQHSVGMFNPSTAL